MNGKLTHTQVKAIEPGNRIKKLFDGGGLYIEVRPSGGKFWRYAYRFGGRLQTLTIGQFPDISLSMAREKHAEARRILAEGRNPADERRKALSAMANTLASVAAKWKESHCRNLSESRTKNIDIYLRRHILPPLGHMPVTEINGQTIIGWTRRLESIGTGPHAIAAARIVLGLILDDACAKGLINASPLWNRAVKKAIKPPKGKHLPAPIDESAVGVALATLWRATASMRTVDRICRLLPYLAVRPSEACAMRWENIDLKSSEWRYDVPKTGTKHIVPLSRQALEIIGKHEGKGFVFATSSSFEHAVTASVSHLYKRAGLDGVLTPHGCRAMFRTLASEQLGYSAEILELQLAHKIPGPLGDTYQRARFLDQRRRLMQEWADYIDCLRESAPKE